MLTDEFSYRLLRLLEVRPDLTQRGIADDLGISLGRVNYCLRALIGNGLIQANAPVSDEAGRSRRYLITPRGMKEKSRVTTKFLRARLDEYEKIKLEIHQLRREVLEIERKTRRGNARG
ncbi:MAG: MarR family EPS-associated transcriptional regulator [Burkholderiales bacterium]|nr:MarR family EPS-associated transcriptional regulator [Burkholderiales bacterium]